MRVRLTICLDDKVIFKLRKIQAKEIRSSSKSRSLSSVINDELRKKL